MQNNYELPPNEEFNVNTDYEKLSTKLEQQINSLNASLQKYKLAIEQQTQLCQSLKDFKKTKQAKKKIFQNYLSFLQVTDFKKMIQKKPGCLYYMIVGNISAGKSSLINYFLGANQDVGVGQTTSEAKCVKTLTKKNGQSIYYWDTPGTNQQFNIASAQTLGYFKSADKIFVVAQNGLNSVIETMRVITKINPHCFYYVRTKCDTWDEYQKYTLDQQRQRDMKSMISNGILISKARIFQISVRESMEFRDNKRFQQQLKN